MARTESMIAQTSCDAAPRPVTAAAVAAVCLRYPSEQERIVELLLQTRGRLFVRLVFAALRAAIRDTKAAPVSPGKPR